MADDGRNEAFFESLERIVADAVAQEAARERSQSRVLRAVAEEEATFAGVAVDLAERGALVVARTTGGRMHRGCIVSVGRDFAVLDAAGRPVVLALAHLGSLRLQPGTAPRDTSGARPPRLEVSLAGLLAGLAAERPRVQVGCVGDDQLVQGELRSAGVDVATLLLDGGRAAVAYLSITAIADVALLG